MGLLNKFFDQEKQMSYDEQIVDHLTDLLNTKRDFGYWQEDFGLKNYCSSFSREKIIEEIKLDIARNIQKFEKRVEIIDIQSIANNSMVSLGFRIECRFCGKKKALSIVFDSKKDLVNVKVES